MRSNTAAVRVVEAVARKEGVEAEELAPPLGSVIDAEVMNKLVQSRGTTQGNTVQIEFEYRGYTVEVRGGPEVDVSVQDTAATPSSSPSIPEEGVEESN